MGWLSLLGFFMLFENLVLHSPHTAKFLPCIQVLMEYSHVEELRRRCEPWRQSKWSLGLNHPQSHFYFLSSQPFGQLNMTFHSGKIRRTAALCIRPKWIQKLNPIDKITKCSEKPFAYHLVSSLCSFVKHTMTIIVYQEYIAPVFPKPFESQQVTTPLCTPKDRITSKRIHRMNVASPFK